MKNTKLMTSLTRSIHKVGFSFKKHSPEILVVAGVIGTVTSTVMACKATTKVEEILEETKDTLDLIHEGMETGEIKGKTYTQEDGRKDLVITYTQTGVKLLKLYGPSIAVGVVSIGCMVASNQILRKRNVALAAAYATIDKSFKEYRGRVVERFGEKVDKELKYGIKAKEIEEKVVDPKTGEEKTVKKTEYVMDCDGSEPSEYARFFDCGQDGWEDDPEFNLMLLRAKEKYFNDKLVAKGYVFLNDVYNELGITPSKAGQIVGWKYDPKHPKKDNYISFGIYNYKNEANRRFVNGDEATILLDFNVDGPILDDFNK